jgi:hypothetical protein
MSRKPKIMPVKQKKNKFTLLMEEFAYVKKQFRELESTIGERAADMIREELDTMQQTFKAQLIEHRIMKKLMMELTGTNLEEWNSLYFDYQKKEKERTEKRPEMKPN